MRVTGPDRLSWLHSLTSQHLLGLAPRTSRESLILSPKGHIEHALHVVDDGESTWLGVEPGTAGAVVQPAVFTLYGRLERPMRARVEALTAAALAVVGAKD